MDESRIAGRFGKGVCEVKPEQALQKRGCHTYISWDSQNAPSAGNADRRRNASYHIPCQQPSMARHRPEIFVPGWQELINIRRAAKRLFERP